MPKLYLVRHAEPAVTGVLLGESDPPLSPNGRAQAVGLLASLDVAIVYTSPLRRAQETAQASTDAAPIEILGDLREISYGAWDGKTWAEIEAGDPDLAARKRRDWLNVTPPGGEPWPLFAGRVRRAFDRIRRGPLPCAVVAHSGVNAVIHQILTGGEPARFLQRLAEVKEYEL